MEQSGPNMKAAVYARYGPPEVVEIRDVPKPSPRSDEIRIRVHATTVASGDWRVRSMTVPAGFGLAARLAFGIAGPRQPILGTELAGVVDAVGKLVSKFRVGDEVFAFSGARMGCHAEYKCMRQDAAIAHKPPALSFDQAAALSFGGTTALDFFRRANLKPGETVLVHGASGAVGTAAVQLAKHFGAIVTGVCSARNAELVQGCGADYVIDYASEDFTRSGIAYDVIMDNVGTAGFSRVRNSLNRNGRLLMVVAGLADISKAYWAARSAKNATIIAGPSSERAEDLRFLANLADAGAFVPVIDRVYPFESIVEAHRHVDSGRKRGNVVVEMTG
jgi:NADPH:quinone reductase-like Zn-dependent oxidoreductase